MRISLVITRIIRPRLKHPPTCRKCIPNPNDLIRKLEIDFVIPMSIDWHDAGWAAELIANKTPVLSPYGEGMRLERERDFGRVLSEKYGIHFPESQVVRCRMHLEVNCIKLVCLFASTINGKECLRVRGIIYSKGVG